MINEIKDKAITIWHNHKMCIIGGVVAFVIGAILF
jgi:hypothetical protein